MGSIGVNDLPASTIAAAASAAAGAASEIDPLLFRRVMGRFVTGVTVITAEANGVTRGMTANAFMSGSLHPPLCIVSVARRAHMHDHLAAAGRFGVNMLSSSQEHLSPHFAGRPIPDFDVAFTRVGGIPVLADSTAWITADVAATHPCGDHTIVIGHIREMADNQHPPLVYHAGQYVDIHARGHHGSASVRDGSPALSEFW
jgi:flavin reductase (DIM6/NTAB) family NADH-FMN oxidoreductase RutF